MEKIPSFTIDHIRLLRGIYVSRRDNVGGEVVTTFDVRMKEPNREPVLSPSAIHTMEHLVATFLRNHPVWADRIIYWGPMGCLTGNYLIVKGDLASADILPLVREAFAFVAAFEGEVPGATVKEICHQTNNIFPFRKNSFSLIPRRKKNNNSRLIQG